MTGAPFTLDTSGAVTPLAGQPIGGTEAARFWRDLSPFVRGYIEAALREIGAAFDMLAPETLARIIADCAAIMREGREFDAARSLTHEGAAFWGNRQAGEYADLPPLTVQLGDDGKVYLA